MAVVANGEAFDFVCDAPRCGFSSGGWPEETMATQRGEQHYTEHATGEPMVELIEFERQVGYVRSDTVVPANTTVHTNAGSITFDAAGNVLEVTP